MFKTQCLNIGGQVYKIRPDNMYLICNTRVQEILKLDANEILFLKYLLRFVESGKQKWYRCDGEIGFFLNYGATMRALKPSIGINTTESFRKFIARLAKKQYNGKGLFRHINPKNNEGKAIRTASGGRKMYFILNWPLLNMLFRDVYNIQGLKEINYLPDEKVAKLCGIDTKVIAREVREMIENRELHPFRWIIESEDNNEHNLEEIKCLIDNREETILESIIYDLNPKNYRHQNSYSPAINEGQSQDYRHSDTYSPTFTDGLQGDYRHQNSYDYNDNDYKDNHFLESDYADIDYIDKGASLSEGSSRDMDFENPIPEALEPLDNEVVNPVAQVAAEPGKELSSSSTLSIKEETQENFMETKDEAAYKEETSSVEDNPTTPQGSAAPPSSPEEPAEPKVVGRKVVGRDSVEGLIFYTHECQCGQRGSLIQKSCYACNGIYEDNPEEMQQTYDAAHPELPAEQEDYIEGSKSITGKTAAESIWQDDTYHCKCDNCGASVGLKSRYCDKCGADFGDEWQAVKDEYDVYGHNRIRTVHSTLKH